MFQINGNLDLYILLGNVRTLFAWADAGFIKKLDGVDGWIPLTRASRIVAALQPGCKEMKRE